MQLGWGLIPPEGTFLMLWIYFVVYGRERKHLVFNYLLLFKTHTLVGMTDLGRSDRCLHP